MGNEWVMKRPRELGLSEVNSRPAAVQGCPEHRGAVDWSSCGQLGRGYKEVKRLMRKGVARSSARSSFWAFKGKPREGAAFFHLL